MKPALFSPVLSSALLSSGVYDLINAHGHQPRCFDGTQCQFYDNLAGCVHGDVCFRTSRPLRLSADSAALQACIAPLILGLAFAMRVLFTSDYRQLVQMLRRPA
ncbi:hypothetical protein AOQ71_40235 [Bradyrhizobium manausense]|uniref:Uncharacterized protein n=1 Tax=Bradyrhizobium manausense TaxID=989370 RepID=A0A0R3CS81_9BRAD|nr:hypothetical protein AOQ71_40235 [Bradyrhizobium manausense]